ncbi:unnamed protein product [Cylicocyclus nassatus]|uniref:Uncharacterized protein n=1 Tax=Cylicocyclus nassatus TaxID=53992 RepID=A0AA36GPN0_CYLNA|nr:unnamed protein product [Cylicocyclus nassatus]
MKWALIAPLLLFKIGTVISVCEGMDSKDPLVKKLADEGCNSHCKAKKMGSGSCKKMGVHKACMCISSAPLYLD